MPIAMPSLSVVLTLHNAERFAGASISAALRQDHGDYEVIALDDGSTDGTPGVCAGIGDARFRYICSDRVGRARALNLAIGAARGRYIAINDADDISFPNRLSYTGGLLDQHPHLAMVGTDVERTDQFVADAAPAAVLAGSEAEIERIGAARLYRSNPFVHSSVMFRKDAWSSIGGYDETLAMCVDYDFFLRIGAAGGLGWSSVKTVRYYTHPHSYFKRRSRKEYYATLVQIRRRARRLLKVPLWARVYDFMPAATVLRAQVSEAASRLRLS